MAESTPILSQLSMEKLTGENFLKWKQNINIVLIGDNSKFVMTAESPEVPVEGVTKCNALVTPEQLR